jgi:hypothetical protein
MNDYHHTYPTHRGVHHLAGLADDTVSRTRAPEVTFITQRAIRVVWTRNASEAINLVANTWGAENQAGDEVRRSGVVQAWRTCARHVERHDHATFASPRLLGTHSNPSPPCTCRSSRCGAPQQP